MKMGKGKFALERSESMKRIKYIGKTFMVILTYYILLRFNKLIMFWVHMQQATSLEYTWAGKRGEFFFWAPFELGLPCLFVLTCILFLIFNGRDLELGRWRQIRQISKKFWQELWIKAAVLAGSIFGVLWFRIGRLHTIIMNSVISPWEIYYFLSGTAVLQPDRGGGEVAEILDELGTIFSMHMFLGENDVFDMGIAFIIYEFLRICFDKKVPLKNGQG